MSVRLTSRSALALPAALLSLLAVGTPAAAGSLTGAELAADATTVTYTRTPVVSGTSLVFGTGSEGLEKLLDYPILASGTLSGVTGTIAVQWTRPSTGNSDNDPFFGITDGTHHVSVEYGNDGDGTWWFNQGAYTTANTFQRTWTTMATSVGYSTGTSHGLEIDFDICTDGTVALTEVRSSFGAAHGPYATLGSLTLDPSAGLRMWVGAHEQDEPLTVDAVSWSVDAMSDVDADGTADACDFCPLDDGNDADGDGFCESVDNCPTVANANQLDTDGDGEGDACEADADNDGVDDDVDNCTFDSNPDQADSDGDGSGDACDADLDGDGVDDAVDACLDDTVGGPVLDNGCTVDQECACDAQWKNHGAYVGCVAKATRTLVDLGLLTSTEKGDIQSTAGASSCGHK